MHEADENSFRNLLSRLRQEDPKRFLELICSSILAPMEENTIASIRITDDEEQLSAMIMVFKGEKVASWANAAEIELREKLAEGGQ